MSEPDAASRSRCFRRAWDGEGRCHLPPNQWLRRNTAGFVYGDSDEPEERAPPPARQKLSRWRVLRAAAGSADASPAVPTISAATCLSLCSPLLPAFPFLLRLLLRASLPAGSRQPATPLSLDSGVDQQRKHDEAQLDARWRHLDATDLGHPAQLLAVDLHSLHAHDRLATVRKDVRKQRGQRPRIKAGLDCGDEASASTRARRG